MGKHSDDSSTTPAPGVNLHNTDHHPNVKLSLRL